jgi:hypothetical protein
MSGMASRATPSIVAVVEGERRAPALPLRLTVSGWRWRGDASDGFFLGRRASFQAVARTLPDLLARLIARSSCF